MYTALYRKWRPKTFGDVIGQRHITETLKNEIVTNRLSHAYLFIGSRGTGKTTCARILAKAVNCPNVKDGEPCNECEICKGIDNGTVLDITEIDAASNNGVDNIRDLREEVNFNPAQTKYRVYIIDEVHMLSQGAFNALLKTLEEPPEHVKFILATTEAHKMPATILSRCQRFDFKRIGADDMSERLMYIAEREQITLTNEAANLISRLSDGAMRDALSIMDQCIARSKDINTALVGEVCGIAGKEYLGETAEAVLNNDSEQILSVVSKLYENACDMERYCSELINYFRNIMVARATKKPEKLIICSDEELENIKFFSEKFTLPRAIAIITVLQDTYAQIKSGVQGRTAMEMALVKLASPEMDSRDESVLNRLAELENKLKSGEVKFTRQESIPEPSLKSSEPEKVKTENSAKPVIESKPELEQSPKSEPEPEAKPEPEAGNVASSEPSPELKVIRQWPEILQELSPVNRLAWTILNGTSAKSYLNKIIVFGSHPSIPDILAIKVNSDDVLAAANKVTGASFGEVICEKDAGDILSASDSESASDPLGDFLEKAKLNDIPIEFI